MIVAIVTDELRDNEMIEEGRRLARNCSGVFVSTNDSDWTSKLHDSHMHACVSITYTHL